MNKERHLFFYATLLLLLFNLGSQGVTGPAVQSILQKGLQLPPTKQAIFSSLTDIPNILGFLFGFLRDRWRPFRRGDRGYFLLFPIALAFVNFQLASAPFTYERLVGFLLVGVAISTLLGAATNGLLTAIAQYHGTPGRFAILLLVIPRLVSIFASSIGGKLGDPSHQHLAFQLSGLLCLPLLALGFWKPTIAFAHEQDPVLRTAPENTRQSLLRLAKHKAIYLPATIMFLWSFAPGWGTPLSVYLMTKIGLSEAVYGNVMALLGVGTLVSAGAYTVLCVRLRLRPLLYWGTFLGVVGCPLFLLIHTPAQAYVIAFLAGASLSIALCAFNDLLIRCCPTDLEGAAFLFVGACSTLAADTSSIFGAWLYEKGGFGLALGVSTVATGAIFCVLPFIPKIITAHREGERLTEVVPVVTVLTPEH